MTKSILHKGQIEPRVILHTGIRTDNGEAVTGFLTKMWGQYHILLEDDENTAFPVLKDSIEPCLEDTGLVKRPWNRWYVSEEMIPRLQDTVLICKGWYDKEKYKSDYEALRAYWASLAVMEVEDIGYAAVLQCLLLPACEAFLCNRKFCEIFYERIYKLDIVMREFEKVREHKEKADYREMDVEYLIEILTGALFELRNDEFFLEKRPETGFCVV